MVIFDLGWAVLDRLEEVHIIKLCVDRFFSFCDVLSRYYVFLLFLHFVLYFHGKDHGVLDLRAWCFCENSPPFQDSARCFDIGKCCSQELRRELASFVSPKESNVAKDSNATTHVFGGW